MYEVETRDGNICVGGPGMEQDIYLTIGEARHLAGQLLRQADALQYGERNRTLADLPAGLARTPRGDDGPTPAQEIAGLG